MTKRARTDAPLLLEKNIAATCVAFMELDSWRAIKMEPISRREWGKGTGEVGQPDYLFLRYVYPPTLLNPYDRTCVKHIWVEFKRPGGKASLKQLEWHERERARGALTWLAGTDFPPTIEAFMAHYRASGLARRV